MRQVCVALRDEVGALFDDMPYEALVRAEQLLKELNDDPEPLTADEIRALVAILPASGETAYGLAWTVLHRIEASPHWPVADCLEDTSHEWVQHFKQALANSGL